MDAEALFAKVAPSVWTVIASNAQTRVTSQGSAVVIGPGKLVTNCHVLARMTRFEVVKENMRYAGQLEFPDPENDLCQISVANFTAPAVPLAETDQLRVGMRVYAIGTPQGLEATLSDGLLSGLRRDKEGRLLFVQTTAPISPGSSGGGLFDAEGRLVGIMTFIRRESQNINLAVPSWQVAELPERGRQMLARRLSAASPARAASGAGGVENSAPITAADLGSQRRVGDWFEYVITDDVSQAKHTVHLKVDNVVGDRVIFNNGTRIEDATGRALEASGHMLAELDAVTPPEGWAPGGQVINGMRPLVFNSTVKGAAASFDLTASVSSVQSIRVSAGEFNAVRIELQGWHARYVRSGMPMVRYNATVWYSPQLQRVIRFSVKSKTASSGGFNPFWAEETLELVRAGRN